MSKEAARKELSQGLHTAFEFQPGLAGFVNAFTSLRMKSLVEVCGP